MDDIKYTQDLGFKYTLSESEADKISDAVKTIKEARQLSDREERQALKREANDMIREAVTGVHNRA